jgi:hypothetical protein
LSPSDLSLSKFVNFLVPCLFDFSFPHAMVDVARTLGALLIGGIVAAMQVLLLLHGYIALHLLSDFRESSWFSA